MILSSISGKDVRKFGVVLFLFFGFLGIVGFWRQKEIIPYIFGSISVLGVLFVVFPGPLQPIYKAWLKITHLIGSAVTFTVLVLTYFVAVLPIAMVVRIMGGKLLPMTPDKKVMSYWVARSEPAQSIERFSKRY